MVELFFTMEGSFGLYHPTLKIKGKFESEQPAVLMPRHGVFGDYQLLFDIFPKCEFCPFIPSKATNLETMAQLGADGHVEEHRVMCLSKEKFTDLCELYPQTAESLKLQGLKKRKMFLDSLTMQEVVAKTGRKKMKTLIY